jgi:uncharacterized protein
VHISEIANRFIKEPAEVLKAGQIVKVKVLSADAKTKRIALSIKALEAAPATRSPAKPREKPAPPSMQDNLRALASKWKTS